MLRTLLRTRTAATASGSILRASVTIGLLALACAVIGAVAVEARGGPTPLTDETAGGTREFPDAWYYIDRKTGKPYARPASLEGRAAPALKLRDWIGDPVDLSKLEGRVIVVDFWGTWCGPCMRSIPKNVAMVRKHADDGLVFIGVHDSRKGYQRMSSVAEQKSINYPVAIDDGGKSVKAYKVHFWPTYFVIDRKGVVRAGGVRPNRVGEVVEKLLAEPR